MTSARDDGFTSREAAGTSLERALGPQKAPIQVSVAKATVPRAALPRRSRGLSKLSTLDKFSDVKRGRSYPTAEDVVVYCSAKYSPLSSNSIVPFFRARSTR
jgi:hypothetical protein